MADRGGNVLSGSPETHVKPDWGKVFAGLCRVGPGKGCLWPKGQKTCGWQAPERISKRTGVKFGHMSNQMTGNRIWVRSMSSRGTVDLARRSTRNLARERQDTCQTGLGQKLLLAQRGNRIWLRNMSTRKIGVKLILPEGRQDFWLRSPKTHVKPGWGKSCFWHNAGTEETCRAGVG